MSIRRNKKQIRHFYWVKYKGGTLLLLGVSGQAESRRLQHPENGNYNKHAQIIKAIFQGYPKA